MYFMFVDEAGDTGMVNSPSPQYLLTGVVIHETRIQTVSQQLAVFRQSLATKYEFPFTREIHAAELAMTPRGLTAKLQPWQRLRLLRDVLDFQVSMPDLRVLSVVISKQNKPPDFDVHEASWSILLQRYHNTLACGKFPNGSLTDHGQVVIDGNGYFKKLRALMLRMRQVNPIRLRRSQRRCNVPITRVIDDPVVRDSKESRLIQLADVNSWWLWQSLNPNHHVKTLGGIHNFQRLMPVCCKEACREHPMGTVYA